MSPTAALVLALFAAGCVEQPPLIPDGYESEDCDLDEGPFEVALAVISGDGTGGGTSGGGLTIDWGDQRVWAVAVTSPGAQIGRMGRVESGRLYWMVAADLFGGELEGPLTFGQVPDDATDYTRFAGGAFSALAPDSCYELQISDPDHRAFGRARFRPGAL